MLKLVVFQLFPSTSPTHLNERSGNNCNIHTLIDAQSKINIFNTTDKTCHDIDCDVSERNLTVTVKIIQQ